MRFFATIFCFLTFLKTGNSQPPIERIDNMVNIIESKKRLSLKVVCDTSKLPYSDFKTIECLKFYSKDDRLIKVVYSFDHYHKDTIKILFSTRFDVYYYNDGLLIKVISTDSDKSPPENLQFYLEEKDKIKYVPGEVGKYDRHDGINYFIETGYLLLEEFEIIDKK